MATTLADHRRDDPELHPPPDDVHRLAGGAPVSGGDAPFEVDAEAIAHGFGIAAAAVPGLLRAGAITGRLYEGAGEDAGRWLCVFFFRNARLQLVVDRTGRPIRRSTIDFGERPLPASLRDPAAAGVTRNVPR